MSFGVLSDLNWLAVIVAAVAFFALGGIWYAPPVFGRAWRESMGWDMPEGQRPGPAFYIGPLITCFISSVAVAMIARATGSDTVGEGIVLGLVVGVGIAGAVLAVTGLFDPKKANPQLWAAIAIGYQVVGLVLVGVIVSTWR
ncbi:MAG TPA: DUF1761 domain-containing protein [Actinomycetota bacterium]|nr:DUF1761 domain-containing protein [Actinomycetota bacterium]